MLSLMKYQEPDPKLLDLYNSFDPNAVPALLEALLNGLGSLDDGPISASSVAIQGVKRMSALFTNNELQILVISFYFFHKKCTYFLFFIGHIFTKRVFVFDARTGDCERTRLPVELL